MSRVRRALYYQIIGLAGAAGAVIWLNRTFPLVDYILRAQQAIGAMEFWGGVLYPMLYAACNILLLPGGVLAIGSGLFFGLWWGFALNMVGNLCAAAVSFLLARRLGRAWLEKKFFKRRKWALLDAAITREGWKIIFLSQLHPLFPTSLLSYMYGVTRIPFGKCMLWIALGQAPGLFLYAYLGTVTQLGIRLVRGQSHPARVEYVIWIGGLLLTLLVTTVLGRLALRLLAEAEEAARLSVPAETGGTKSENIVTRSFDTHASRASLPAQSRYD
jgi:uncharacterized membrane protein YdjX (TVP38/TMEM64 family)